MIPKQVCLALLLLSSHLTPEMLILLWWLPSWWKEWSSILESIDILHPRSFPRNNLPQPAPIWLPPLSTKWSTVSRTLCTADLSTAANSTHCSIAWLLSSEVVLLPPSNPNVDLHGEGVPHTSPGSLRVSGVKRVHRREEIDRATQAVP